MENGRISKPLLYSIDSVVNYKNDGVELEARLRRKALGAHLQSAVAGEEHYPLVLPLRQADARRSGRDITYGRVRRLYNKSSGTRNLQQQAPKVIHARIGTNDGIP